MKDKHIKIRGDRKNGHLWLTEEKPTAPLRKVADLTPQILIALCFDHDAQPGTDFVEWRVRLQGAPEVYVVQVKKLPVALLDHNDSFEEVISYEM